MPTAGPSSGKRPKSPPTRPAEGFALALETINRQASTADQKTMTLQYLDALKQIGGSASSKIVVPMELAGLAAGVVALADQAKDDGQPSTG